jgi:1,4-dihydroxy-2-naphthoyl-CoA synthase
MRSSVTCVAISRKRSNMRQRSQCSRRDHHWAGRAFCAGGDIAFMAELMQRRECGRVFAHTRRGPACDTRDSPDDEAVIASINGPASGAGCNLALACDLRIASTQPRSASRLRRSAASRLGWDVFSAAARNAEQSV